MRRRTFGHTDLETSAVGFGTWALGSDWWGEHEAPEALVARALDLGITFFDTGDTYGQGLNEELVGEALERSGRPRDAYELSTKFGYVLDAERKGDKESERPHDWSPEHTRRSLENSLRRLRTDYVDLYQLHNPRMDGIEADALFTELEALKAEGKLRHYGIALGPKIGWRDEGVHALAERSGMASLQTVYNLLEQAPGAEFLELAEAYGVGVIARVPTSSGLLEGHLTPDHTFEGNDHRRHRPRSWLIEGLQKVDQLGFLTRDGDRTLAQAAFKYVLAAAGHRLRDPHGQHRRPARGVGGRRRRFGARPRRGRARPRRRAVRRGLRPRGSRRGLSRQLARLGERRQPAGPARPGERERRGRHAELQRLRQPVAEREARRRGAREHVAGAGRVDDGGCVERRHADRPVAEVGHDAVVAAGHGDRRGAQRAAARGRLGRIVGAEQRGRCRRAGRRDQRGVRATRSSAARAASAVVSRSRKFGS